MDRDGRQGWSRKAEEGWLRVFGEPGPRTVAFPDQIERKLVEGFKASTRVDSGCPSDDESAQGVAPLSRSPVV